MDDGQANATAAPREHDEARRVVISYPDELGAWSRDQLESERFRTYLRRVLDEVPPGYEWTEFVDVGCCGNSPDIPLRIESVDGLAEMGPDTEIEYTTRESGPEDVETGWRVQSEDGPSPTSGRMRDERR